MIRPALVLTKADYFVLVNELADEYEPPYERHKRVPELRHKIERALAEGCNVVIRPDAYLPSKANLGGSTR